eukprot:1048423-Pyramimonas_sp.AAC.1
MTHSLLYVPRWGVVGGGGENGRCNVNPRALPKRSQPQDTYSGRRLLKKFCLGLVSAAEAQRTAADILRDYGDNHDATSKWASLGSSGTNPSNCHRDLIRWCSNRGVILEPVEIDITCKAARDHGEEKKKFSVLYPHEIFGAIFQAGPKAFQYMMMGGDQAQLKAFWEHEKDKPWVQNHPGFLQYGHQFDMCIPIGVHADKGQHISRDKVLNIAWGSTTCRAPTLFSKFLFTVVPDEFLIKGKTDEELYSILAWSLQHLVSGRYPQCDHNGTPWPAGSRRERLAADSGGFLAGGFAGLFSEYRGDWEWSSETFMWRPLGVLTRGWRETCTYRPGGACKGPKEGG